MLCNVIVTYGMLAIFCSLLVTLLFICTSFSIQQQNMGLTRGQGL